jgi:hypothetical protein
MISFRIVLVGVSCRKRAANVTNTNPGSIRKAGLSIETLKKNRQQHISASGPGCRAGNLSRGSAGWAPTVAGDRVHL